MAMFIILSSLIIFASGTLAKPGSSQNFDERLIGGEETTIKSHPYQVSIELNGEHVCGGTIIGKNKVLTVAQCLALNEHNVNNITDYTIRVGTTTAGSAGQERKVSKIVIHEKFDFSSLDSSVDYNVAIIKVSRNFELDDDRIQSVELSEENDKINNDTACEIISYETTDNPSNPSGDLKMLAISAMSDEECKEYYQNRFTVTSRMMCVIQDSERDSKGEICLWDTGSPLMCRGKQFGIVNYFGGCTEFDTPILFTRVSGLREWIDANGLSRTSPFDFLVVMALFMTVHHFLY